MSDAVHDPSHCLRCGASATTWSPNGHAYCATHGRCAHCGKANDWAWHTLLKVWVCRCYPQKQWLRSEPEPVQVSLEEAMADLAI